MVLCVTPSCVAICSGVKPVIGDLYESRAAFTTCDLSRGCREASGEFWALGAIGLVARFNQFERI